MSSPEAETNGETNGAPTSSYTNAPSSDGTSFDAVRFLLRKRYNESEHDDDELRWWIAAYTRGDIPDYQMSAWLMAVCFQGLSIRETATLTRCMVDSGVRVDWSSMQPKKPLVDKHSSGGVGDKVSLILAPLVAALGVAVPMMAGRGLGHTGGTIDKLESIPGFRTDLSVAEFQNVVGTVGCAIVSAGEQVCPADRKLYALRDVTGTVANISLQTASIMSKKIAEHPDSLVLDVKYGRGAFQQTAQEAAALAKSLVATGEANGLNPTIAFLTKMDHPIGCAVGNWIEVKECIEIMKEGKGSQDLIDLVVVQAGQILLQSGLIPDITFEVCVKAAELALNAGKALEKFREMVIAQGGDVSVVDNVDDYPKAKYCQTIVAEKSGVIKDIDALAVGEIAVQLGAGRKTADEPVDPQAGILFNVIVGDLVEKDYPMATIMTNREGVMDAAVERLRASIVYSALPFPRHAIVTHRVSNQGIQPITTTACVIEEDE